MALALPESTRLEVGKTLVIPMGEIPRFHLLPHLGSIGGRSTWIVIYQMLELIDADTIWNEKQRAFQMILYEAIGIFFKEEMHPWVR